MSKGVSVIAVRVAMFALALSVVSCTEARSAARSNMSASAYREGDYPEAVKEASKAIEIKPDFHLAYVNRGTAFVAMRQYDRALADYQMAIALKPDEAVTHLNYCELLVFLRRNKDAVHHAEVFVQTNPHSNLGKLALAQALEGQDAARAYQTSTAALRSLETSQADAELQYVPKDYLFAYAYALHGRIAADVGKGGEAQSSIEKAAGFRNDYATRYAQARVYYSQRNWDWARSQARAAYDLATPGEKNSPIGVESRFLIGNCALKLGDLTEARTAYEDFISANETEPEAYFNLGQVYAKKGDVSAAIKSYTSALQLKDTLIEAYVNRGSLYLRTQRYDEAVRDFSRVLVRQPDDATVLYKRAYAYCVSGHTSEGRRDLRGVLRLKPDHSEPSALLTQCGG